MKKISILAIAIFSLAFQQLHAQNCPTVRTSGPDLVKEKEAAVFTVSVTGGDPNVSPTFNWSISSGTIESGQGTSTIHVNTEGLGGQSITATVELGGFSRECAAMSSTTTSVEALPVAELNVNADYTTTKAFNSDANKFALDILTAYYVPQAHAVVFLYPGKNAAAAAAIKEMIKTLKAVFTKNGMKSSDYKIVTAGKRAKTSYEMWIVPGNAKDPVANPAR